MPEKTLNPRGTCARLESVTANWRAGVAKDKLIFIIICSVALAVAVVVMTFYFKDDPWNPTGGWLCLECNHQFDKPHTEGQPVYCPECGEEAASLLFHRCPKCDEKNVIGRVRFPQQGGDAVPGAAQTEQAQFRLKEFGTWTDWMPPWTPVQRANPDMECTKCGAKLYGSLDN